jgi:hypothetical protein
MPGTTPHGLPYPLPTEPVAEGAAAIRALAEAADTRSMFRIADVILSTDTVAGLDITGIPQDFRELMLYTWIRCAHTAAEINIIMQLNGDNGTNYYLQHIQATGTVIVADQNIAYTGFPGYRPWRRLAGELLPLGRLAFPELSQPRFSASLSQSGWTHRRQLVSYSSILGSVGTNRRGQPHTAFRA